MQQNIVGQKQEEIKEYTSYLKEEATSTVGGSKADSKKRRRKRGERKKKQSNGIIQNLINNNEEGQCSGSSETPQSQEAEENNQQQEQTFEEFAKSIMLSQGSMLTKTNKSGQQVEANMWNMNMNSSNESEQSDDESNKETTSIVQQDLMILASAGSGVYNVVQDQKLSSTDESVSSSTPIPQILPPKQFEHTQLPQPQSNLNEDINMQLYGQISMFDQLTDYNDIDNDEDQVYNKLREERGAKGEDEDDLYSDNGEEEAGNLYLCRQRIQAINEEIQNFIGMMMGAEDDDQECNGEDPPYNGNEESPADTNNLSSPSQYAEFNLGSRLHKKRLQYRLKRLQKFVNSLDQDLTQKQQLLDQRDHMITKLTREKAILQDLLDSHAQQEELWQDKDREQKLLIEKLTKENDNLKSKLLSQEESKKHSPNKSTLTPRSKEGSNYNLRRRNSQSKSSNSMAILQQSPILPRNNLSGSVSFIKQQKVSPKANDLMNGSQTLVDKILSLKQHNESELLRLVTSGSPIPSSGQENMKDPRAKAQEEVKEFIKQSSNSPAQFRKNLPLSPNLNYLRGNSKTKSEQTTPQKSPLKQQPIQPQHRFSLQPKKLGSRSSSKVDDK